MTNANRGTMLVERNTNTLHRPKFGALLHSDTTPLYTSHHDDEDFSHNRHSNASPSPRNYADSSTTSSNNASPNTMSPWNNQAPSSPFNKSPWLLPSSPALNLFHHHHHHHHDDNCIPENGLVGSLVREEGHIYSLAVSGDLLYTGSDSKNIRVWKDLKDFTGFKSSSGLVKTIVISGGKIFTGHQDGKIRVWKVSSKNPANHKRVGSLPTFKEYVKSSMNPKNYVEVRRRRNAVKVKHFDAVSSLSLDEEGGLLYSGSWDKTLKGGGGEEAEARVGPGFAEAGERRHGPGGEPFGHGGLLRLLRRVGELLGARPEGWALTRRRFEGAQARRALPRRRREPRVQRLRG
ncbi:E3 ubiquitin-protein ligase TRAF7 [Spatholobus suberectus]|nr:E3 ubiquitin-protein ligase TRAF7 [Spatholobus suberectus]